MHQGPGSGAECCGGTAVVLHTVGLWQEAGAKAQPAWQSILTHRLAGALKIIMWEKITMTSRI